MVPLAERILDLGQARIGGRQTAGRKPRYLGEPGIGSDRPPDRSQVGGTRQSASAGRFPSPQKRISSSIATSWLGCWSPTPWSSLGCETGSQGGAQHGRSRRPGKGVKASVEQAIQVGLAA